MAAPTLKIVDSHDGKHSPVSLTLEPSFSQHDNSDDDDNAQLNLPSPCALMKRQQLQMERDLLDAQLRYLEELEMARRSGTCHTRATSLAIPTKRNRSAKLDSYHNRSSSSTTSKPCANAPHCFLSKTAKSDPTSSAASTVELSTSSHSMRRECSDYLEGYFLQDSFENSFNDLVVDTVITCDDSHSFCSGITIPLTPEEELDHFICTEIPAEVLAEETALLQVHQQQQKEEEHLERGEATHRRKAVQDGGLRHQDQERQEQREKQRRQRKTPLKRRPADGDVGDAQPGRARNMPWLIAFDDGKTSLRALYSGPLVKELPYGIGTLRMKNGDMYMGEIVWGAMHGAGTYWSQSDSQVHRGQFVNNVFQKQDELNAADLEVSASQEDDEVANSSKHARQCKKAIRKLTRMLIRLNEVQ